MRGWIEKECGGGADGRLNFLREKTYTVYCTIPEAIDPISIYQLNATPNSLKPRPIFLSFVCR